MAADRNLDIALRIKTELNDARKQVAALEAELGKVSNEGKTADKNLRGTGAAVDKLGDTSRRTAGEVDRASEAVDRLGKRAKNTRQPLRDTGRDMQRVGLSAKQQAQAMRLLPAQITDIVTGLISGQPAYMVAIQQGGQLRDSFGGVGGALKGIGRLITPTRLLIGGLTGAVALLSVELVKGYLNAQHLESALIATGNYAGTTATQLQNLATSVADGNGGYADARKAVLLLAQSGKITEDALDDAARGAVAFAQLTGASIEDAVDAVVSLQDKPVEAIRKLDQQYHFLETSIYAQIIALQKQDKTAQAAALAQKTFADAMAERRDRDVENLGSIQRAWRDLRGEIAKGIDVLMSYGSASIQAQLNVLYAERGKLTDMDATTAFFGGHSQSDIDARIAEIDKQIASLKDQAQAEKDAAEAAAKHDQVMADGNAALDRINARTQQNATAAQRYANQIKAINADFDAAIKAMPKKAGELNAQRSKQLRTLADSYAKSLTNANGGGGGGSGGNNNVSASHAAARAKAAASAQQQLIDTLQQLQAVQDPVASAWVKYWNVVDRATAAATRAKQATGANTAAIDGQLAAIKTLAAGTRDAAIDKIAQKDQRAWESLRDSLRTPLTAKVDGAIAKITQLNQLMQKGVVPNAQAYAQALDRILSQSLDKQPTPRGIQRILPQGVDTSATPIGATFQAEQTENDWFAKQQEKLAQERAAALEAARKYGQDTVAVQQQYDIQQEQLKQKHAQTMQQISQARHWAELQMASVAFGNLATLARQRYGEQSKLYRALFALSKTFAVAQAAVSLATNVAKASEAGYPYNIPFVIAAFAQGAQIAALISGASFAGGGGYAEGGYTGRGGKYQVAGIVHAGEGVLSQRDMAALGGPQAFEAFRQGLHGYADGGYVNPLANVPPPSLPERPRLPTLAPSGDGGDGRGTQLTLHNHNYIDIDDLRERILSGPEAERHTVNHVLRNGNTIKQEIS